MKRLFVFILCLVAFVGCGYDNVVGEGDEPKVTIGSNGFVPGGEFNLLSYPIGLNHQIVNERNENVWQYFYDYDATDEDDFQYLVNISMYCNADEDFNFLSKPILFDVYCRSDEFVVDHHLAPVPYYTTPYLWSSYYCVFSKGSHPYYYKELGYRYEMHFPMLFPTPGEYRVKMLMCQPVEIDKFDNPNVEYGYKTEWFTIIIYDDKHDDTLPECGGQVVLL